MRQLIIWACFSFQPEDWLCDWSQTADRPSGAAHPGFDHAHEYLHTGERNLCVPLLQLVSATCCITGFSSVTNDSRTINRPTFKGSVVKHSRFHLTVRWSGSDFGSVPAIYLTSACFLPDHRVSVVAQLGPRRVPPSHRRVCRLLKCWFNWFAKYLLQASHQFVKMDNIFPLSSHRVIDFYRKQRDAMIASAEIWLKGKKQTCLQLNI